MATPHVVMYCTAICPYCIRAEQLLKRKGIAEIEKVRIDLHRSVQHQRRRVAHVGGCDDLHDLDRQGRLDPLLAA